MAVSNHLTVPAFAVDGSVNPVALGGALVVLTAGGWVENKGSTMIYMVRIGDNDAESDPVNNGVSIVQNGRLPLSAGVTLGEYGLLSEGGEGAAFVIGK